jgi:hypothetical protein
MPEVSLELELLHIIILSRCNHRFFITCNLFMFEISLPSE